MTYGDIIIATLLGMILAILVIIGTEIKVIRNSISSYVQQTVSSPPQQEHQTLSADSPLPHPEDLERRSLDSSLLDHH